MLTARALLGLNVGGTRFEAACSPADSRQSNSTWYLAQCPSHGRCRCSPRVRPFPPRPPPQFFFVRRLPRYYGLIRLLIRVHARRALLTSRAGPAQVGHGETSQVRAKELLHVHKVSTREASSKQYAMGRCCLLFSGMRSDLEVDPFRSSILGPWSLCERFTAALASELVSHSASGVG